MPGLVPCLMVCLGCMSQGLDEEPLLLQVPVHCADGKVHKVLEPYHPQPGDIVLFSCYNPFANLVFYLGNSGGVTHAGMVVLRPNGTLALLETNGKDYPVMLSDIPARFRSYNGRVWVRRLRTPLCPEQSTRLTEFACAQENKPYAVGDLLAPLFRCPVRKRGCACTSPEELDPPGWVCSSLTVAAGIVAGLLDPCVARPRTTDPEDLKKDHPLDLSPCWEKPIRYQRCGPRLPCWWSESSCGQRAFWKE
jgi:hypothetical protein